MAAVRCSRKFPVSTSVRPKMDQIVKPRLPPSRSPSSAVASVNGEIQVTASGSRGTAESEVFCSMSPFSLVSIASRSTVPQEKSQTTAPECSSTRIMWLFSWSVTAQMLSALMSTNSGSGSSGYRSQIPVRSTFLRVQLAGSLPTRSTMTR